MFGSVWGKKLARSDGGTRFTKNMIVRILIVCALFPIALSVGIIWYFIHPSSTPLILHYNVYFGVDLLGVWWQAYALPFLGVLFFTSHFFLAWHFYSHTERIACYLLLLSSGMLSLGILIASISTVFINY